MVRAYWGHTVGRRTSKTVIFSASLYILQAFKFLTLSILFSLEDGYWFRFLLSDDKFRKCKAIPYTKRNIRNL
jgi:hypothetical protein